MRQCLRGEIYIPNSQFCQTCPKNLYSLKEFNDNSNPGACEVCFPSN
jgi:hypothetical protein